jgi:Flp pilus assembly protein TadD
MGYFNANRFKKALGEARAASRADDWPRAAEAYEAALRAAPGRIDIMMEAGYARVRIRDLAGAEARFRAVVASDPRHGAAWTDLGHVLRTRERTEEALACYQRACDLEPGNAKSWHGMGVSLVLLGRPAEAALRKALELSPGSSNTLCALGNLLLSDLARHEEALACLRQAVAAGPGDAHAHFSLSLALLLGGRLEEGWPEYEWRRSLPWWAGNTYPGPRWDGGPLEGRRIFLHHEQGLGDFIQFSRYLPRVAAAGGGVTVSPPRLLRTLAETIPGVRHVVCEGEPIPPYDVCLPLMSLPGVFRTGLDTIPSPEGYLRADPGRTAAWATRLEGQGVKVGLCWQGNPGYTRDLDRSIPLARLAPLLDLEGFRFVSLQKGAGAEQAAGEGRILDLSGELGTGEDAFSELAAIIANLDLVLSVDTAPAHLAGALGRPVFLLLPHVPEWRWLLDRGDSPWYESMRIFRQPAARDWAGVVEAVGAALAAKAWPNRAAGVLS